MKRRTKWILGAAGAVVVLVAAIVVVALVRQRELEKVPDHFPRPEPRLTARRVAWPLRFGINANIVVETGDAAFRARQLRAIRRNGLTWIRVTLKESWVEPAPGETNFAITDRILGDAAAAGLEVAPVVAFTPEWASSLSGSDRAPAKDPEVTDRIVTALVERYGQRGSFWREHPEVKARPIRVWEIWNEENSRYFFAPRSGTTYAHHAVVVARAIRTAQPSARILFGGLAGHLGDSYGVKGAPAFLADAIKAQPSLKELLDGVAYHSYRHGIVEMTCRMREQMDELGLERMPLVINEFGAPTSGQGAYPEQQRATIIGETVRAVVTPTTCKRPPNVVLIAPYSWWSTRRNRDHAEDWFGIVDDRGQPLLSGRTYLAAAAGADRTYPR